MTEEGVVRVVRSSKSKSKVAYQFTDPQLMKQEGLEEQIEYSLGLVN